MDHLTLFADHFPRLRASTPRLIQIVTLLWPMLTTGVRPDRRIVRPASRSDPPPPSNHHQTPYLGARVLHTASLYLSQFGMLSEAKAISNEEEHPLHLESRRLSSAGCALGTSVCREGEIGLPRSQVHPVLVFPPSFTARVIRSPLRMLFIPGTVYNAMYSPENLELSDSRPSVPSLLSKASATPSFYILYVGVKISKRRNAFSALPQGRPERTRLRPWCPGGADTREGPATPTQTDHHPRWCGLWGAWAR